MFPKFLNEVTCFDMIHNPLLPNQYLIDWLDGLSFTVNWGDICSETLKPSLMYYDSVKVNIKLKIKRICY